MLKIPHHYHLSSTEQCRSMDEKTISEFGIDGFTLMEIAGTRAADFIQSKISTNSHGLFFCGKGNNAGDALVVARLLSQQNYKISICFVAGTDSLSSDANRNLELLQKLEENIEFISWQNFSPKNYDFIVDGMLGTGLNSDVRSPYAEAIDWVNEQEKTVFALDVPSGLNATTGIKMGCAVQAHFTLTFGALKTGLYLDNGFDSAGKIILCELSFPNKYKKPSAYLIDHAWVDKNSTNPKKQKHKYDGGVLYIIAGSEGLTGAAALVAKSAWATGIGAVILITPKGLLEVYEKNLIQIIKKPVGDSKDVFFKKSHLQKVIGILNEKPGKVIIGPGLGRNEETIHFAQQLLKTYEGDILIDADALYALSKAEHWERPVQSNWIITPHPGELKLLLQNELSSSWSRIEQVWKKAVAEKITILSKGLPSVVGTVTGERYLTGYDTRIFSRAGFGDVLAGKIGANWLIYNSAEFACFHALLNSYEKATQYLQTNSGSVEPLTII